MWGGVPELGADGKQTGRTLITQTGLAELGGYLKGARDWMASAASCIEASR